MPIASAVVTGCTWSNWPSGTNNYSNPLETGRSSYYVRVFRTSAIAAFLLLVFTSNAAAAAVDVPTASFEDFQTVSNPQYQHAVGNTIYVNPAQSGAFQVRVRATSASGIQDVEFPALGATGWTPVSLQSDSVGDADLYQANYTWTAGADDPANPTNAVARANSSGTTSVPFHVDLDSTAPTGGSISTARNGSEVTITYANGADTGSGIRPALVQRQRATHLGSSCDAFGAWEGVVTPPAGSFVDPSTITGFCYRYRLLVTDNVDNAAAEIVDPTVHEFPYVFVDSTPPAFGSFVVLPTANEGAQRWDGTTLWFNPTTTGAFSVRTFVADAQSGMSNVTFGPFAAGFTVGQASFDAGPYQTAVAWSAGAPAQVVQVIGTNSAGGSATVPLYLTPDATAPAGASISLPARSQTGIVTVTLDPGADSQSGLAGWMLQRRSANITSTGCGEYRSDFVTVAEGTAAGTYDDRVGNGTCHTWRLVTVDSVGNAAVSGEASSIVQRVIRGTVRNDRLRGTARPDLIAGGRGNDFIFGYNGDDVLGGGLGNDRLFGGSGFDRLIGGPGNDGLFGGGGADRLEGGGGHDILVGGPGSDTMLAGPGRDRIIAGPGNDLIGALDGSRDRISCGPGRDRVIADRGDIVAADCEQVAKRVKRFKKQRRPARR